MAEVRLLGGLRKLFACRSLAASARSVSALLDELAERGGSEVARVLFANPDSDARLAGQRAPHQDLRVLVNGRSMQFTGGLATPLEADDTVTLHLAGVRGFPGG